MPTVEGKQYVPSKKGLDNVLRYYLHGVFAGETHPHHTTPANKFNPIQRFSYTFILFVLLPLQIITGSLFYFFPDLRAAGIIGAVDLIAILHTFTAYSFLAFLIVHVYMITFGRRLLPMSQPA